MNIDPAEYVVMKKSDLEALYANADVIAATTPIDRDKWIEEHRLPLMTIPEFQKDMVDMTHRWFPEVVRDGTIDLNMLVYGICGEAGEIAEEMKKFIRGSRTQEQLIERLGDESVDCFHYIALLWVVLGIDPGVVYKKLTEANEKRFGPKEG